MSTSPPDLPTGLRYDVLDPHDTTGDVGERLRGFQEAVAQGFHEGRSDDDRHRRWLQQVRDDAMVLRGVWPEQTALARATAPVATFTSWAGRINVGGGTMLPLHMITDVTVAPTHRRRGLLRRLMTHDLAEAAAAGRPLAALTVSEGSIYGRFGFGPATRMREIVVDVTSRFALRHPTEDGGRVELVDPTTAWSAVQEIFAAHAAETRGAIERPHFYRAMLTGEYNWSTGTADAKLRAAVGVDADGRPDAYVLYRLEEPSGPGAPGTLKVEDLASSTPAASVRMWRFLADIDLVERVQWRRAGVTDSLDWAVVDHRGVRTTSVRDLIWVRVLDLPTALEARPWRTDGRVVLDVADPLGHVAGRWAVEVSGARASVVATDEAGEVALDVDTLGALYLGDVDTPTLAAAGRLTGSPEALATWAAIADGGPAPYCTTAF